jgi:hypothetical protein
VRTLAVPSNLEPSLGHAHDDEAPPFHDGCDASFTTSAPAPCVYGDPHGSRTIIVTGDSHAAHWWPAFESIALQRHWRFESLTKATCPPLLLSVWSPVLGRPYRECDSFRAAVLQRIRSEHPALVVLGLARHYSDIYHFTVYGKAWIDGLHAMVQRIRATGSAVLVLGPTPKPFTDVPDCLAAHLSNATMCLTPFSHAVDVAGMNRERAAVQSAGGHYVDVAPWMCTSRECAVIVGNLLVYRDDNHLSTVYPKWLTPLVAAQIDAAVSARD